MSALAATFAAIDAAAVRGRVCVVKRIADKLRRGRGRRPEGPFCSPLTIERASVSDAPLGIRVLSRSAPIVLRNSTYSERVQFRGAMLCLRWRRRFERPGLLLVVDNTTRAA